MRVGRTSVHLLGARFRYLRTLKCPKNSLTLPLIPKENDMRIVIYILMAICLVLLLLGYSLLVIASEADEKADRMYRKWKESKDEREQKVSDR